jgi:hypothetical protein
MKKIVLNLFSAAVILASCSAVATTHYVDVNGTNATPPYIDWTTAATNIQDAVDAAVAGDEVVVTNGTYSTGGLDGNRVKVDKPLNLRSVNGPQFTTIDGVGSGRCVCLTSNASLSGFSIVKGFSFEFSGGGAYGGTLNNCRLIHNSVSDDGYGANGGGAAYSTLNNCALTGNSVEEYLDAGVPQFGDYGDGGGAYNCTLNNCTLSGNSATITFPNGNWNLSGSYGDGGAAANCTLNNCLLTANTAGISHLPNLLIADFAAGGGAARCTLNNCTLSGNSAYDVGGGVHYCALNNCIVYFNIAGSTPNLDYTSTPDHCWAGDPLFVDTNGWANLRLQSNSPCVNAGNIAHAPTGPDLDGNPRIVGGAVDIGAYEFQSLSLINFSVVSNQAGFSITGQSNQLVIVQTSTDLLNWSPLVTNTLNGHPFPFSDPTPATLPQRFYRAQTQ